MKKYTFITYLSTISLRHIGRVEAYLHAFLTLALDGGEWMVSCPGHFTHRVKST